MRKNLQIICKLIDFELPDIEAFDHFKGLAPKRIKPQEMSIFSAKNPEKMIISCENPLKTKELDCFFQEESDFKEFSRNYLENYDVFQFDKVLSSIDSQEALFINSCKSLIKGFFDGESACVLLLGAQASHQNYVLRGGESNEKGLILRTFEEILSFSRFDNKKIDIDIGISLLYGENLIDLLSEDPIDSQLSRKKDVNKFTKQRISSLGELKNAYDMSHFKLNKQLKDAEMRSKSHYFFTFEDSSNNNGKISFVRLAEVTKCDETQVLKGLRRTLQKIDDKNACLLTYLLGNSLNSTLLITVISQTNRDLKERTNFILNYTQKLMNSIGNIERPPLSPKYKEYLTASKKKEMRKTSPTSENTRFTMEKLKEKEGQLDKDLTNLIDRYNKSKNLIESIPRKKEKSSTLQSNVKKTSEYSTLEKDIAKLKSHIVDKLDQSQRNSEVFSKFYPETTKNNVKIEGSFKKMKGVFEEKEEILLQKCENYKKINEDLKENLREYVEKKDALEGEINQKEGVIEKLQENIKVLEDTIRGDREGMRELQDRYEELVRNNESINGKNDEIMRKLEKKVKKIHSFKQKIEIEHSETQRITEKCNNQVLTVSKTLEEVESNFKNEVEKNKALYATLEKSENESNQKDHRISQLNNHISGLDEEIGLLKQRVSEENLKFLDLLKDHENLKQKLDDTKESLHITEAKNAKNKVKFDEEKRRIMEEKDHIFEKKRQKLKKTKEEKNELLKKIAEISDFSKNTEKEVTFLTTEKKSLETDMMALKQEIIEIEGKYRDSMRNQESVNREKNDLQGLLQTETNDKNMLKGELEKNRKTIKGLEKKIADLEENSQKDFKSITEIKQENGLLLEERTNLKEICGKLETQLDYLQNQHNQEIGELDKRAEKLIDEMRVIKEENVELRQKETELRKNLMISEENQGVLKEKYLKLKFSSRTLKSHLKEVEDKLRDYTNERQLEIRELELSKENTQKAISNKMRLLDDIQSMVKNYRVNNKKLDFSGF